MRRSFKSIHTRYMLTFMAIMIITIFILGIIITNIITSFSLDTKLKELYETNVHISSYFKTSSTDGELAPIKKENGDGINEILDDTLNTIFLMSPQAGVLVFDETGRLLLFASKNEKGIVKITEYDKDKIADIITRRTLPGSFLNRINRDGVVSISDTADGYFSSSVYLYASEIITMVEKEVPPLDDPDDSSVDGEESETSTDSKVDKDSETESESDGDISSESDSEFDSESDTEIETESNTESETESNTETESDSETESDTETESDSETESDTESGTIEIPPEYEEKFIGAVICYDPGNTENDKMMRDMIIAIFTTILWITIVSLIAIYGVSYYTMKPLRDIGRAAKSFSRGKYDIRVKVRGNDELAELADSFNKMATAIQSKDEMQKNFLSNVSHDLKTPMTTIAGFIDGILDGAIPPEKEEYYLNIIKNEVKRLSRLVTSLLDISRLQSGERKFEFKHFNMSELVRQTVLSFEKTLEEKNLDVEFDMDDFDMMAYGDKDAINQVVYNFCHNAIKFSNDGAKYKVSLKYQDDKTIIFKMYNEGIGISSEDLPFVFDRFYKSDKSRGLDKTGTGLGLFIAKTIVDAHGQSIKAESEFGKWCEMSFTIATKGE